MLGVIFLIQTVNSSNFHAFISIDLPIAIDKIQTEDFETLLPIIMKFFQKKIRLLLRSFLQFKVQEYCPDLSGLPCICKVNTKTIIYKNESYINNDSCAPHIKAPIIAFISQYFGRKVSRGSYNGFTEAFLSNNTSKSKITQFNLKIKQILS